MRGSQSLSAFGASTCAQKTSSVLNRSAPVALPMTCLLATAGCGTPGKVELVSSFAPLTVETVPDLSLPADERAALLRAAAAALERSPDPLPVVQSKGTLPTQPAYRRAVQARKDWGSMSVLANAYAMNSESRHLDGYARDPSLGFDVYRIAEIGSTRPRSVTGCLPTRSAGAALPPALSQRMRQFGCDLAARYTQPQPKSRKTSTNNWQSHRVKLAVMGAHVCGKPALIVEAEAAFATQIQDNLLPTARMLTLRSAMPSTTWSTSGRLLEAALVRARGANRCLNHRSGTAINRSHARLVGALHWRRQDARGVRALSGSI